MSSPAAFSSAESASSVRSDLTASGQPVSESAAGRANAGNAGDIAASSSTAGSVHAPSAAATAVAASLFDPKVSTAQLAALMRAIAEPWKSEKQLTVTPEGIQLGVDSFARFFLTADLSAHVHPGNESAVRAAIGERGVSIGMSVWGRTRVIDSQLYALLSGSCAQLSDPIQQLVIAGAGFDSRCYRFRKLLEMSGVDCFELDRAELQAEKRAALARVEAQEGDIGLSRVHFLPMDFSRSKEQLHADLAAGGFVAQRISAFVLEGVTSYLTPEACETSLTFMAEACVAGSFLIVTFVTPEVKQRAGYSMMQEAFKGKKEVTKNLISVDDFKAMLQRAGWDTIDVFTPDRLKAEYSNTTEVSKHTAELTVALAVTAVPTLCLRQLLMFVCMHSFISPPCIAFSRTRCLQGATLPFASELNNGGGG
jgi:methyltransferase (TIGR00027 family)